MSSVFNFCAGPAMLPHPVMKKAQQEFINWQNQGVSVMEMSHRSKPFMAVAEKAEQDLRDLMNIPNNYKVLFCHGGGRGQFAAVPLNLLPKGGKADYIVDGSWSESAAQEAANIGDVNIINISQQVDGKTTVIPPSQWPLSADASYVHYCPNETVNGIELFDLPETGDIPLIADMSSTILSREIDVSKFGLIYAGAQKNIGPSGLAIVIVREDLIGKARKTTPNIMNYQVSVDNDSMHNTPPTYAWYLAGLVFQWLKDCGGVKAVEAKNKLKAKMLYDFIDDSDFYINEIDQQYRSRMNIPFWLSDETLNQEFLAKAEENNLLALKGHRIVGGMRASIYNAMPIAGVEALIKFMDAFAKQYKK
ncbi:MAG: 3-phosphoserine/phosphohydroxythreonine transaminase [Thalassotalea sp.]